MTAERIGSKVDDLSEAAGEMNHLEAAKAKQALDLLFGLEDQYKSRLIDIQRMLQEVEAAIAISAESQNEDGEMLDSSDSSGDSMDTDSSHDDEDTD